MAVAVLPLPLELPQGTPRPPRHLRDAVALARIPYLEDEAARSVLRDHLIRVRPEPRAWARAIPRPAIVGNRAALAARRERAVRGRRRRPEGVPGLEWALPTEVRWYADYLCLAGLLVHGGKLTHRQYAVALRGDWGRSSLAHRRIAHGVRCGALVSDHPPVHRREHRGHHTPLFLRPTYFPGLPVSGVHRWMASVFAWLRAEGVPPSRAAFLVTLGGRTQEQLTARVLRCLTEHNPALDGAAPLTRSRDRDAYTDTDNPAQETTRLHVPIVVEGVGAVENPRPDLRVVHREPSDLGIAVSATADGAAPTADINAEPGPANPAPPAQAASEGGSSTGGGRRGPRSGGGRRPPRAPGGEPVVSGTWEVILPGLWDSHLRTALSVYRTEAPTAAQLQVATRTAAGRLRLQAQRGVLHDITPERVEAWLAAHHPEVAGPGAGPGGETLPRR